MPDYTIKKRIEDISVDDWKKLLEKVHYPVVFQSPEMYQVFEKTRFFKPYITAVYSNEKLLAVLHSVSIQESKGLKGYFSKRTLAYGGPVIDPDAADKELLVDVILKALIRQVRNKSIFIQFRNFRDLSRYKNVFENNRFHFEERLNLLTPSDSEQQIFAQMSSSKRRQIRKSLQNGAEVIAPENEQQIHDFYAILQDLYQNRVKKPLPRLDLFLNFYREGENKAGVIRLIRFENKIIGGILSPVSKGRAIYEWYVCGLDREYSCKGIYPSVLATWAAIDYGRQNNIPVFDFMGVGRPDRTYGVRDFKMKFGGELVNYGRWERINNRFLYSIAELGYNFLLLIGKI